MTSDCYYDSEEQSADRFANMQQQDCVFQRSERLDSFVKIDANTNLLPSPGTGQVFSDDSLVFESRFESGNLNVANKVSDSEYNLVLQNDINSQGHTQWFYFSVANTQKQRTVKFNIINLGKRDSLFNQGMSVLVFSEKEATKHRSTWVKGGKNISYFRNNIRRPNSSKHFYTLTFEYEFTYNKDKVYFAYSHPYTYSDLQTDLHSLESTSRVRRLMRRETLCLTLSGKKCEILTITAEGSNDNIKKRRGAVFTARVHPGETVGSWVMKGLLDFLTSSQTEAALLREAYVFKIVPMLNPDGVICGNYRCSLAGCDLNRRWKQPSDKLHPTIFYTKKLIKNFMKERRVDILCDFHGHSRRKNVFIYGCKMSNYPEKPRLFPLILSKVSDFFDYSSCSFNLQKSKESTMRISMFKETHIPAVYTLEASFCGLNFGPCSGQEFDTQMYKEIGKQVCLALTIYADLRIPGRALKKSDIEQEFVNNTQLLEDRSNSSSGSDSEPSEDNLDLNQLQTLLPKFNSNQRKETEKRSKSVRRSLTRICPHCGHFEEFGHICKDFRQFETIHSFVNQKGKRVRNQSTQTDVLPKATFQDLGALQGARPHFSGDLARQTRLAPLRKTWGRNTAGLKTNFHQRVESPYKLKMDYFQPRKSYNHKH